MSGKPIASDVQTAVKRLAVFQGRLGYPPNSDALLMAARAFARIVHFKAPVDIVPDPCAELAGVTDDSMWLVEQMYERHDRFPTLDQFRAFYRLRLPPRVSRGEDA